MELLRVTHEVVHVWVGVFPTLRQIEGVGRHFSVAVQMAQPQLGSTSLLQKWATPLSTA